MMVPEVGVEQNSPAQDQQVTEKRPGQNRRYRDIRK
jgi:hypothetical protein